MFGFFRTKTGSNRSIPVWLGFFGLVRFFWFGLVFWFDSVFSRFGLFFPFGFSLVQFSFFGFRLIKPNPNQTDQFF
jgi:hypothetical protein